MIYYIGGDIIQPDDPFIYAFNPLYGNISFPNIGIPPQQRVGFQAEIFDEKIYLFVGSESDNLGRMIILNTCYQI